MRFVIVLVFSFFLSGSGQARPDTRVAEEMAECGFLIGLATEQLHEEGTSEDALSVLAGEVTDFVNLYYATSGLERPSEDMSITLPMYRKVMDEGRRIFEMKSGAMSSENANRMANNILNTCREDLQILGLKLRHG